MLSWNSTPEQQRQGIEEGKKSNIYLFLYNQSKINQYGKTVQEFWLAKKMKN